MAEQKTSPKTYVKLLIGEYSVIVGTINLNKNLEHVKFLIGEYSVWLNFGSEVSEEEI